jgi:two-component system response regulator AtoC
MNSNLALRENLPATGERVDVAIPESSDAEKLAAGPKPTLRSLRAAAEILAIKQALQETGWNRKRAAQLLSISYRGLLYKLHEHRIVPQSEEPKVTLFQRKE